MKREEFMKVARQVANDILGPEDEHTNSDYAQFMTMSDFARKLYVALYGEENNEILD